MEDSFNNNNKDNNKEVSKEDNNKVLLKDLLLTSPLQQPFLVEPALDQGTYIVNKE